MKLKTKSIWILAICLVSISFISVVQAAPTVSLSLYKNNGYGLGDDMNGLWTVNAAVSANVVYVEFNLDGVLQENDTSAPFSWQFDTANYIEGSHTISAVAYDASGESATAESQRNFVGVPIGFIATIFGVVAAGFVVATAIAVYRIRKNKK